MLKLVPEKKRKYKRLSQEEKRRGKKKGIRLANEDIMFNQWKIRWIEQGMTSKNIKYGVTAKGKGTQLLHFSNEGDIF